MRNMMFGFGAAVLVAGMLAFGATPVSAGEDKPCWAHLDTDQFLADGITPNPNFNQLVTVWANGGGHEKHALAGNDVPYGPTPTYADCALLVNPI